jgi:hypothetical protein
LGVFSATPLKHEYEHEHEHEHKQDRTIDVPMYPMSIYELSENPTATDKMIRAFDPDHGLVALPKGQPNILPSEQFPWDASKEVYVLSGFHSLHSLVNPTPFSPIFSELITL